MINRIGLEASSYLLFLFVYRYLNAFEYTFNQIHDLSIFIFNKKTLPIRLPWNFKENFRNEDFFKIPSKPGYSIFVDINVNTVILVTQYYDFDLKLFDVTNSRFKYRPHCRVYKLLRHDLNFEMKTICQKWYGCMYGCITKDASLAGWLAGSLDDTTNNSSDVILKRF